jgi:uncharacterized protein (DUF1330 family)
MKATIIVEGVFRPGYETYFEEYSARVRRYLEKHAGQVIRRQRIEKVLYGEERPDLIMVIDFPDRAVAERIFFEQEYLDILPLRDKIFSRFEMYLASYGEI